jgi:hypothetical protein
MTCLRPSAAATAFVVGLSIGAAGQDATTFADDNVRDLFTRSRMAAGAAHVPELTGLLMRGNVTAALDAPGASGTVDIKILLPDCYLRIDRFGRLTRRTGFCGKSLLTANVENGQESRPPSALTASLLQGEQDRLARLLLGAATYVSSRRAMTFKSSDSGGGRAEAYRFEAAGDKGLQLRIVLDPSTMLPSRVDAVIGGKRVVSTAFSERRLTTGLKLPYRLTTSTDGTLVDDVVLTEIVVNPPLTKADFELERSR